MTINLHMVSFRDDCTFICKRVTKWKNLTDVVGILDLFSTDSERSSMETCHIWKQETQQTHCRGRNKQLLYFGQIKKTYFVYVYDLLCQSLGFLLDSDNHWVPIG